MTLRVGVVEFAGRGGMVHYAFQLCRALARSGAEVSLYTDRVYELAALDHPFRVVRLLRLWDPKPAGEPPDAPRLYRLRRVGRGLLYYREWYRLVRRLRRDRPDVVQFGDIRFPGDGAFLALLRASGLRLVDICHNVEPFSLVGSTAGRFRVSRRRRRAYRRIYRQFERVFVHYDANRRRFLDAYGGDPAEVVAIPHGNEALFAELRRPGMSADEVRRDLALPSGAKTVLLFGTLSRYKGVDLLLEAFVRVHEEIAEARLVFAGYPLPDFDLAGLRQQVERLGLTEKVRIVPRYIPVDSVAAWMEQATVAVFPYREIYQSGALLVAQTFGVPTVATRVGAMEEAVLDGESAVLVPPDDPEALSQALSRLLSDGALRRRLGAAARRHALGAGSWEAIAGILRREYACLCESGPAGSAVPAVRRENP